MLGIENGAAVIELPPAERGLDHLYSVINLRINALKITRT